MKMKGVALKRPRPHSLFHNSGSRETRSRHLYKSTLILKRMSCPDYSAQGWQSILVSLNGPLAIVKLNRAKQYADRRRRSFFFFFLPTAESLKLPFWTTGATR
jgi:hypothetical protein